MSDVKKTVKDAGHKIADTAKTIGKTVAAKAEQATEWVKEKTGMSDSCGARRGASEIQERMDVIASCGKKVGVVDHVEGGAIKLTRNDSPDGQHHFIPTSWVDHVDTHVHLKKNSVETEEGWKSDATSCSIGV